MKTEHVLEWMMQSLDGELDPVHQTEMEGHLAQCGSCQAEWMRLQALEQLLRGAPTLQPSAGFTGRVMAGLDRRRRAQRVSLGGFALALAAVAVAILTLGPTFAAMPSMAERLVSFSETTGLLVTGLANTVGTILNSLWLTFQALARPTLPTALGGLLLAVAANLMWLGLMRRLRPVRVNQVTHVL
jgi:predicted anti-sigma-YlaC factor YlaD